LYPDQSSRRAGSNGEAEPRGRGAAATTPRSYGGGRNPGQTSASTAPLGPNPSSGRVLRFPGTPSGFLYGLSGTPSGSPFVPSVIPRRISGALRKLPRYSSGSQFTFYYMGHTPVKSDGLSGWWNDRRYRGITATYPCIHGQMHRYPAGTTQDGFRGPHRKTWHTGFRGGAGFSSRSWGPRHPCPWLL